MLQTTDGQVHSLGKYCFMLSLLYFSRYLLGTSCSDRLGGSCHSVTYAFIKVFCKSEQATEYKSWFRAGGWNNLCMQPEVCLGQQRNNWGFMVKSVFTQEQLPKSAYAVFTEIQPTGRTPTQSSTSREAQLRVRHKPRVRLYQKARALRAQERLPARAGIKIKRNTWNQKWKYLS